MHLCPGRCPVLSTHFSPGAEYPLALQCPARILNTSRQWPLIGSIFRKQSASLMRLETWLPRAEFTFLTWSRAACRA